MVLPTLTLGLVTTAVVIRVTRSSVLEVLGEPYIVTARAKGLHPRTVALRHVLKGALIPTVTIVGINTGYLLGGAVIVEEAVLAARTRTVRPDRHPEPRLPRRAGDSYRRGDALHPANLLADLTYAFLDPRIKY
jgi:peptide/nickel transport system permease protein